MSQEPLPVTPLIGERNQGEKRVVHLHLRDAGATLCGSTGDESDTSVSRTTCPRCLTILRKLM